MAAPVLNPWKSQKVLLVEDTKLDVWSADGVVEFMVAESRLSIQISTIHRIGLIKCCKLHSPRILMDS